MNDIIFHRSFGFNLFRKSTFSHTDSSKGLGCHFLARMVRGRSRIVTDTRRELTLEAGDVFYLPLGLKYNSYWYPDEGGEVSWESYRFGYMPINTAVSYGLQKLVPPSDAIHLMDLLAQNLRVTPSSVGLFYQLLGLCLPVMQVSDRDRGEATVEMAKGYMLAHPEASVGEVARHCVISESGLYSLFRRVAGMTPVDMKNTIKAERAAELLECTSMSVEDISRSLGFCNSSYFRSVIKRYTGKTPSEIRKNAKQI